MCGTIPLSLKPKPNSLGCYSVLSALCLHLNIHDCIVWLIFLTCLCLVWPISCLLGNEQLVPKLASSIICLKLDTLGSIIEGKETGNAALCIFECLHFHWQFNGQHNVEKILQIGLLVPRVWIRCHKHYSQYQDKIFTPPALCRTRGQREGHRICPLSDFKKQRDGLQRDTTSMLV